MKTLPIAALALTAAAAPAFTIDLLVGSSRPGSDDVAGNYETNTLTGLALAWQPSKQVSLGLTAQYRDLEWKNGLGTAGDDEALTATFDLTWELGSENGGIKPFIGVSAGATFVTTDTREEQSAFTATAQAGLRFAVSDTVDIILGMRHFRVVDVDFTVGADKRQEDIAGWESFLGLRFKF